MEQDTSETKDGSGRLAAAIGYIPIVGLLASIILHGNNKTKLSSFHLRQALGMHVTMLIVYFVGNMIQMIPVLGWLVNILLWLSVIILLLIGFVHAMNRKNKLLPILGETFQKIFTGID